MPQDDAAAFGWYMKSALQGNVDAQCMVGFFFEDGVGTAVDLQAAAGWYAKAAA